MRATALTEAGLALEAVMCDEQGLCVCALETLKWPSGAVTSIEEAVTVRALLSMRFTFLMPMNILATHSMPYCSLLLNFLNLLLLTKALRTMIDRAGLDGNVLAALYA